MNYIHSIAQEEFEKRLNTSFIALPVSTAKVIFKMLLKCFLLELRNLEEMVLTFHKVFVEGKC